jgi:signal transduction histidine kinase
MTDYRNYVIRRLEENQIELKINLLSPFLVEIPRGRLMQVVDNLVRNSEYWLSVPLAKKSIANRQITIEIAKPYVSLSDNGFGIRPEIEDRIFAMFVSDKPKETGRGLGLFITREILLRYGCDITLSEYRNNQGRRFRFDIDLSAIAR